MNRRALFGLILGSAFTAAVAPAQSMLPERPGTVRSQVAGPAFAQVAIGEDQVRSLYYASDASGEGTHPGVRIRAYQTVVQPDGSPATVQVPLWKPFSSGERLRFSVESNTAGFLYIVQRGSSGTYNVLFPVNGLPNGVRRGREVAIPRTGSFQLDATPGQETLYFVLAKRRTAAFSSILPQGQWSGGFSWWSQGCDAALLNAIREGQKDLVTGVLGSEPMASLAVAQSNKDFVVVQVVLTHR